jgi:thiol-disulfide isomerase/thioredoxin
MNQLTRMQNKIIYIPLVALAFACGRTKQNGNFELKGNFSNSNGETIYLEKLNSAKPIIVDSVVIDENGNFEFLDYTPKTGFYRIKTSQQNFAMLILDSADQITVKADVKDLGNTYQVEGSHETSLFIEYNEMSKKRDKRLDSLNGVFQVMMESHKMDSKRMDSLSKVFEVPYYEIVNAENDRISKKIKDNSGSYASIMAIQALDPDKYSDTYQALDAGLSSKFPGDQNVKMFHNMVSKMLATKIGEEAPEIILPSPEGQDMALSSLRGKVVLIDFWASWCGPCRKEMPNVVKAYKKYKNKGFEIFGVSLDQDRDRWLEAIAKDGMTWPQVSDLKYWGSDVVKQYNIQGIPFTVLLDRNGKIIAKNLRGEALDQKLASVLKEI